MNNLQFDIQEQTLYISLKGNLLRLDNILNLYQLFDNSTICKVSINGQHLENWDSSLLLVLFKLKQITENKNISFETANLPEGLTKMLEIALAVPEHKSDKTKQKKKFKSVFIYTERVSHGTDFLDCLPGVYR